MSYTTSVPSTAKSELFSMSRLESATMRNSLQKNTQTSVLNALPQPESYVLSPSLLSQIQDSRVMNSRIVESYRTKTLDTAKESSGEKTDTVAKNNQEAAKSAERSDSAESRIPPIIDLKGYYPKAQFPESKQNAVNVVTA